MIKSEKQSSVQLELEHTISVRLFRCNRGRTWLVTALHANGTAALVLCRK